MRILLLLHGAATHATSTLTTTASEVQQAAPDESVRALAARLLQCCRFCGSSLLGIEGADGVQQESGDLLLHLIPKLLMSHKERLETLARLVAQLMREYAAFVCWMGDKESFLPVKLHAHRTGSKKEQGGIQGPLLPSILASFLSSPMSQGAGGPPKLDAFECLSTFLEKLSNQAEPPAANRPMRKPLVSAQIG